MPESNVILAEIAKEFDPAHVIVPLVAGAALKFKLKHVAEVSTVTVYAVAFDKESKIQSSPAPGTAAPGVPPLLVAQCAVLDQLPVPATQYFGTPSEATCHSRAS